MSIEFGGERPGETSIADGEINSLIETYENADNSAILKKVITEAKNQEDVLAAIRGIEKVILKAMDDEGDVTRALKDHYKTMKGASQEEADGDNEETEEANAEEEEEGWGEMN
jgi:hypothetical protein